VGLAERAHKGALLLRRVPCAPAAQRDLLHGGARRGDQLLERARRTERRVSVMVVRIVEPRKGAVRKGEAERRELAR